MEKGDARQSVYMNICGHFFFHQKHNLQLAKPGWFSQSEVVLLSIFKKSCEKETECHNYDLTLSHTTKFWT